MRHKMVTLIRLQKILSCIKKALLKAPLLKSFENLFNLRSSYLEPSEPKRFLNLSIRPPVSTTR